MFESGAAASVSAEPMEDLSEVLALDELHDVVELALVLAHGEHGYDIGVMQHGRGARLAAEPLDGSGRGAVCRQDLQRRAAAQGQLDRLVDDPHAALADLANDLEARYRRQSSRLFRGPCLLRGGWTRVDRMRGDGVLVSASRLAWRALLLERSQEAGLGAAAGQTRRRTHPGTGFVPGVGDLFQSLLTARASLHVVIEGLLLQVVELLIQQSLQVLERRAGIHRSALLSGFVEPADDRCSGYHSARDASGWSSRALTSLLSRFIT